MTSEQYRRILAPDLEDITLKSFFGMGFGPKGVPIDILPIVQLGHFIPDFTLLVVDELVRLNGLEEELVKLSRDNLLNAIHRLNDLYGISPKIVLASEFMHTNEYLEIFQNIQSQVETLPGLKEMVQRAIPINRTKSGTQYLLNEFAGVHYFSNRGYDMKIGPTAEIPYDSVMQILGIGVSFAYILDSYALGSKSADIVIPYQPTSRGPNNGQRIFFSDWDYVVHNKIQMSCDEALRYLCSIAAISGHILSGEQMDMEKTQDLEGRRLKRFTKRLVFKNIIEPYRDQENIHGGNS